MKSMQDIERFETEAKYPTVLILGQSFNNSWGGGITLSGLFKGWPKDKLAVTSTGHLLMNATTDICSIYYQLGTDEYKWIFPFNLIQKGYRSGLLVFKKNAGSGLRKKSGARYNLVTKYFYPFYNGLDSFIVLHTLKFQTNSKNGYQNIILIYCIFKPPPEKQLLLHRSLSLILRYRRLFI